MWLPLIERQENSEWHRYLENGQSLKLRNQRFVLAASLRQQPVGWGWRMLTLGMPYFIVLLLLSDGPLLVEETENIHCQSACLMDFLLIPSQITAVT